MNAYFGEPWGPMLEEDEDSGVLCVETPVGQLCFDCHVPIVDGDQGLLIPYLRADRPPTMKAHHRTCYLFRVARFTLIP